MRCDLVERGDRLLIGGRLDYASATAQGWSTGGQNHNLKTGVIHGGRSTPTSNWSPRAGENQRGRGGLGFSPIYCGDAISKLGSSVEIMGVAHPDWRDEAIAFLRVSSR
jgi:hypothetical protein